MKPMFRYLVAAILFPLSLVAIAQTTDLSTEPLITPAPSTQAPTIPSAESANRDYRLTAGDTIGVQVYQNPDLSVEARVSDSGVISYPLLGTVQVGGLTVAEAEKKIADGLITGKFVNAPQVTIVLRQIRGNQVSVLGEVSRPGRFPLETDTTRITDVLAAAGGIAPAGGDTLIVTGQRHGKPFRTVVNIPALFAGGSTTDNIVLAGGDTLYVSKAPVFYIYGEAQRPGQYRMERGMTVMQALAQGGGPTVRGSQNRLRLERKESGGKTISITPKLTDLIQPGDVLYVGESLF